MWNRQCYQTQASQAGPFDPAKACCDAVGKSVDNSVGKIGYVSSCLMIFPVETCVS
jgi:hypothetical protein